MTTTITQAEKAQALSLRAYEGQSVEAFDESADIMDWIDDDARQGGRYVQMDELPEAPHSDIGASGFVRVYPDGSMTAVTPKGCRVLAAKRIISQVQAVTVKIDRDFADIWARRRVAS